MTRRALPLRIPAAILALAVSAACHVDFVPRAEAREEWKKSYPIEAGGSLTLENTNGKIVVRPHDGSTIEIVATRIAKAGSDEAAKKLLADTRIEETVSGASVRVSSRQSRVSFGGTQYQVNYDVRAPAGIALDLSATNGTIDVGDWEGRVEMSATNGTLEGKGLKGEVQASTTNGRIDVRMAALADRGVSLETTNGRVSVELPKDTRGRVLARVTNGRISVEGLNVEPSSSNTRRRYEGVLNGGGGPTVSVETINGAITVRGS
ncbi:MAG TPA: DUF4097 family beta strand repeat-containing protein [Vicinamibacterales bacterium]|nr:DUF4097 family beta strand repeat-containing protein [Vicinamibacterales bacterium]